MRESAIEEARELQKRNPTATIAESSRLRVNVRCLGTRTSSIRTDRPTRQRGKRLVIEPPTNFGCGGEVAYLIKLKGFLLQLSGLYLVTSNAELRHQSASRTGGQAAWTPLPSMVVGGVMAAPKRKPWRGRNQGFASR